MDSLKTIPGTVCEIEVRISEERGMYKLTSIITEAHPVRWAREEEALGCAYPWAQQLCEYERSRGKNAVFTKVSMTDRAIALRMEENALRVATGNWEYREREDTAQQAVREKERQRPEDSQVYHTEDPVAANAPRKDVAGNYVCHECGLATALHVGPEGRYFCDRCDPTKAGHRPGYVCSKCALPFPLGANACPHCGEGQS